MTKRRLHRSWEENNMIKNFLSSIVVSLFLILLVILCSENDKEESRHEPQNTWFYMPTQKEVEYEGE